MMRYFLLGFVLFSSSGAWANTPDYEAILEEVRTEADEREQAIVDGVPIPSIIYGNDLTTGDIEEAQRTGQLSTLRSRREGEPTLQERLRNDLRIWYEEKLGELETFDDDMAKEADLSLRHTDGDEENGGLDVLEQLETTDVAHHGPKARESDPAWAKDSSNNLNPAIDRSSQAGDTCMDAFGNSSSLAIDPVSETYARACDGESFAEHSDCILGAVKEINSESKGGSATSTQVFQAPNTTDRTRLQNVDTANLIDYDIPSCPTEPRLAESVPPNIENLIAADRTAFEQMDLVPGSSTAAVAYVPSTVVFQKEETWVQRLLGLILPSSVMANINPGDTIRGRTNTIGRENEIQKQNFEKMLSDLQSYPDMHAEQQFANRVSRMMEEQNRLLRTKEALTTQIQQNFTELANKTQVPY